MGFIENHRTQNQFFDTHVSHVLRRMQEFWALKGAYLLNYSFETKEISTIAVSVLGKTNAFGFPGDKGLKLEIKWQELHPSPYLHYRGQQPPVNSRLKDIIPLIEQIVDKNNGTELKIVHQDCEFVVVVPTYRGVYTFVFAVRDQRQVSSLEPLSPHGISELCQDAILETCCEVVAAFHTVREFVERDKRALNNYVNSLKEKLDDDIAKIALPHDTRLEELLGDKQLTNTHKEKLSEIKKGFWEIRSIVNNRLGAHDLTNSKPSGQT